MSTRRFSPDRLFRKSSFADRGLVRLAESDAEIGAALAEQIRRANKWKSLPEGWTQESVESFWSSITGDAKHKVTKCIKQMGDKVDDAGAFCASLADKAVGKEWRSKGAALNWEHLIAAAKTVQELSALARKVRMYLTMDADQKRGYLKLIQKRLVEIEDAQGPDDIGDVPAHVASAWLRRSVARARKASVEYAIAALKGKSPGAGWQAEILESTNQDDIGKLWTVSDSDMGRIWHRDVPFLGKYSAEDQFIIPIPLTKVRA